jgi:spoIIIJ-associated protein
MEWIVTRGRTLEEALDAALDELGIDVADAEYEVLDEPRGGLLGRLRSGEYRLRVRVRPVSREKPHRRRNRRRTDGPGGEPAPTGHTEARGSVFLGEAGRRPPGGAPGAGDGVGKAGGDPRVAAPAAAPRRRSRSRRGGRREGAGAMVQGGTSEGVDVEGSTEIAEQADVGAEFLRGLLRAMGVPAGVRVEFDEDAIALAVEGEDLGRLIGQRAATLFAIEDLTRAAVLHAFGGRMNRLTVDVGGYRAKRRAALEAFTREQVERVRATGRPVVLEPMSAADRKVVHDVVLDAEGVTSVSEGEEPRRSVVIRPA